MISEIGNIKGMAGENLLRMWQVSVPNEPSRPFRRHSHLNFEICRILGGEGEYTVEEKRYPMRPGDFFVFASGREHCITGSDKGLEFVNLQFEPRYLWGGKTESLSAEHTSFCFAHASNFSPHIESGRAGALLTVWESLQKELADGKAEAALAVKSYLNLLVITLLREYGYATGQEKDRYENLRTVRRTASYIDNHFGEELSLAALAEQGGMSPNYFSTLFRRISGIGLWEYILSRRIDAAKAMLLEDTPQNILDIALACGFNNTANFNKAFKKATGLTPSKYREIGDVI